MCHVYACVFCMFEFNSLCWFSLCRINKEMKDSAILHHQVFVLVFECVCVFAIEFRKLPSSKESFEIDDSRCRKKSIISQITGSERNWKRFHNQEFQLALNAIHWPVVQSRESFSSLFLFVCFFSLKIIAAADFSTASKQNWCKTDQTNEELRVRGGKNEIKDLWQNSFVCLLINLNFYG